MYYINLIEGRRFGVASDLSDLRACKWGYIASRVTQIRHPSATIFNSLDLNHPAIFSWCRELQYSWVTSVWTRLSIKSNMEDLSDPPTDINPYEVLEIENTATSGDVKSAYKKLALRYHPGMLR